MTRYPLICPVCGGRLCQDDRTFTCAADHAFDIARQGYVNLLLMGHKRPQVLGDAKEMLHARRAFLDGGHYAPLAQAIDTQVANFLLRPKRPAPPVPLCIAEVGCGEGYYIGHLMQHLAARPEIGPVRYFGMDIAKRAARMAAARYAGARDVRFFVADVNQRVLFADDTIHVLLNVFAPRNAAEFARVVAPGGLLLVVIPTPDHLARLRSAFDLLAIEAHKRQQVIEQFAAAFSLAQTRKLTYNVSLSGEQAVTLVKMTPNYWHTPPETLARIGDKDEVEVTASFALLMFER